MGGRPPVAGNASILMLVTAAVIAAILAVWFWRTGSSGDAASTASPAATNDAYRYLSSSNGRLFRSAPGRANGFAPIPTTDAPPDPIQISRDAALQAVSSGILQVTLPNRTSYPVRFERQETSANGDWTFVGRVSTRIGKLAAVITFGRAGVFGVLPTPDGRMLHIVTNHGQAYIQPAGGLLPIGMPSNVQVKDIAIPDATRQAISPVTTGVPGANAQIKGVAIPHAAKPLNVGPVGNRTQPDAAAAKAEPSAAAAPVSIKVLGLYTADLVALRGSVAAAESEFTNLIAITNQAHIDSGTLARFSLVGMRQVNYDPLRYNSDALSDIQRNAVAGIDLSATRNALEADLVAMLRPYVQGDPSCGIAYMNGAGLSPEYASAAYGFSVSATESCGPLVMAHELGHNLGSNHDIENGNGIHGAYTFSYGYRQFGPAFGTVMAYTEGGQSWIGYFSNPDSTACLGARCGTSGQADNVRSINLMAERISRFRDPLNTVSIFDVYSVFEPDSGESSLTFEVRLSSPAPAGGVRFDVATDSAASTAVAGSDYVAASLTGQLIPAGQRTYSFSVKVLADTVVEGDETVVVSLRNVAGATLFDGAASGIIRNDDPRVRISGRIIVPAGMAQPSPPYITACSTLEVTFYAYECTSTDDSGQSYSVSVLRGSKTTLGIYPEDPYAPQSYDLGVVDSDVTLDINLARAAWVSGRVKWPEGEPAPTGELYVTMKTPGWHGGYLASYYPATAPDYSFRFKVLPGTSADLGVESPPAPYVPQLLELGRIDGDIVRDIQLRRVPSVSISHVTVDELQGYMQSPLVRVRLSAPAPPGGVRFTLSTFDGTAMSDNDYQAFSTDISVPAGQSLQYVQPVGIGWNPWKEDDEVFGITARNLVGAWLPANGFVHILDSDPYEAPEWVPGDFSGGGADILWRSTQTGANVVWNWGRHDLSYSITSVPTLSWRIVGIGDFDNDLVTDILWRNVTTGRNIIWLNANAQAQRAVSMVPDLYWQVAGVGDFNGDERSDILWRHARTGRNSIWKSAYSATLQPIATVPNLDWLVAGIGDFDGDDRDDIFWRNKRTGENVIWGSGSHAVQRSVTTVTNVDWGIVGVGDFNADRQSDVLWRNLRTGGNVIWLSADSSKQRAVTKIADLDWRVEAVADYNGDGNADVLWRNHRLGSNTIWLTANIATRQGTPAVPLSWQVAP